MVTTKFAGERKLKSGKTLIFPNGMYDYSDINSFLRIQTGKVDPKDKDSNFIFTLYFDMTIFRVVILMHESYELDLPQGEFAELLGYAKNDFDGKKEFCRSHDSGYHKKC